MMMQCSTVEPRKSNWLGRLASPLKLRPVAIFVLLACVFGASSFHAVAEQNDRVQVARQIVSKVKPVYPEIARHAKLQGNVRLRVIVGADGSVASVRVVGGSAALVKAAEEATKKWRWERAPGNTEELVQLTFENP
jgi:TonB family protein